MRTRMNTKIVAMLIGAIGVAWPVTQVGAQVPSLLNYQGRVAVGGVNFDGAGQFKFALVNSGGSVSYWSNGVNAVTCTVTKGLYSVLLGDTNLANMAALPATVFTNADVRLRVWFAPEGSTLQQLAPDQRVAAAGYALNADQLDGLNSTAFALTSSSPTFTGTVTASAFAGNGSGVTNVNADRVDGLHAAAFAQLSSSPTFTGTVGAGGFSGNGAGLTNVNADQLDGQHGAYYQNAANLTGTLNNVQLSTNAALLNAAQAFSQENHFLAKVGVNVTNPQTRLEVRASSNGDGLRVDGTGGIAPAISLSSNGAVCGELALAAAGGQYSSDAVGGDVVLRNDVNGKVLIQHSSGGSAVCVSTNNYVGIHKVNPATALDVNGTVTASNFTGSFAGNGASLASVNADELDGQHGAYYLGATNLTGTVPDARLSTNVAQLNVAQDFSKNNHFLGNIGIGTTNPQKRLEIRAAATADGIRIDGVGGIAPAISLSTNDVLCGELALASAAGQYSSDAAGGDVIVRNSSGKVLIQHSSGGSAVCIATNNYVGIHKASPATALDVNGTVSAKEIIAPAWGKSLSVGGSWGDGPLHVYGSTWTVDQENLAYNDTYYWWDSWQSFTAGTNGTLAAVEIWVCAETGGPWSATFSIYNGEGSTGTVLASQSVVGDGANQGRMFTLETPVPLTVSNQYTFRIHDPSAELQLHLSHNNYVGGRFSYSTNYDADFYTYMIQTSGVPALVIQPNTLNVGIGVTNPTNKLQVAGHIQCTSVIQTSDRNAKENIRPASPDEILAGVSSLHIATWTFKSDSSGTHMGPMAQDFHAAFGLGNTDSGIFTVDADGVALAAIQGLNGKLEAELRAKEDRIQALESRVEKLEKMIDETRQQQAR